MKDAKIFKRKKKGKRQKKVIIAEQFPFLFNAARSSMWLRRWDLKKKEKKKKKEVGQVTASFASAYSYFRLHNSRDIR